MIDSLIDFSSTSSHLGLFNSFIRELRTFYVYINIFVVLFLKNFLHTIMKSNIFI